MISQDMDIAKQAVRRPPNKQTERAFRRVADFAFDRVLSRSPRETSEVWYYSCHIFASNRGYNMPLDPAHGLAMTREYLLNHQNKYQLTPNGWIKRQ